MPVAPSVLRVDVLCALHPFYGDKLDSRPIRLMTIAHAFNYHVAVLRDGVRSAIRFGRSRKVEGCFFDRTEHFMGTSGDCDVSDSFNSGTGGTSFLPIHA